MGSRRRFVHSVVVLAVGAWITTAALAAQPPGAHPLGWEITQATVVDPGQTTRGPDGSLTMGYTIEARARPMVGDTLPGGVFRIVVSAFSPTVDMPRQRAGLWHLRGQWTITDANAGESEKAARHGIAKLKGSLSAELAFNPATDAGAFLAAVKLPTSPVGGRMIRGGGMFSGNSVFEGLLVLDERAGPALAKLRGR